MRYLCLISFTAAAWITALGVADLFWFAILWLVMLAICYVLDIFRDWYQVLTTARLANMMSGINGLDIDEGKKQ